MRTFKDWKDEVYKDWKDKDMSNFFYFCISTAVTWLTGARLGRGMYCHGTDLTRCYGYAYALHGLGVAMTRAQT